jgi:hypothetical protein
LLFRDSAHLVAISIETIFWLCEINIAKLIMTPRVNMNDGTVEAEVISSNGRICNHLGSFLFFPIVPKKNRRVRSPTILELE